MRSLAARGVGVVLAAAMGAIMLVRRPRPIHSKGLMLRGDLTHIARQSVSGVGWIDDADPPTIPVVARLSRSVGLPAPLPDVIGLALRFEHDGGTADIELASSGLGVPSRFVMAPHRSPSRARLGTLLPYRGRYGPVLLCALTVSPLDLPAGGAALGEALRRQPWRLRLHYAAASGKWHPFAEVELGLPETPLRSDLRFDAVERMIPGADAYDWVRAVREPAYRLAQGSFNETGIGQDAGDSS